MESMINTPRVIMCYIILGMIGLILHLVGINLGLFGGIVLGIVGCQILKPFWWNG